MPVFVIWFWPFTLTLSCVPEHLVTFSASKLAQASYPKLCPQQSSPDVAALCAVEMRFTLSYVNVCVRFDC